MRRITCSIRRKTGAVIKTRHANLITVATRRETSELSGEIVSGLTTFLPLYAYIKNCSPRGGMLHPDNRFAGNAILLTMRLCNVA